MKRASPILFFAVLLFAAALLLHAAHSRVLVQAQPSRFLPKIVAASRPAAAESNPLIKFAKVVTYPTTGYYSVSVAVRDLNGDGFPDLVVANACQSGTGSNCNTGASLSVLLANGDGSFQPAVTYASGGIAGSALALADLNGDGSPDIVMASQCLSPTDCGNGVIAVFLNNGDGSFQPPVVYVVGNGADGIAIADLNGDGNPDLAVADECQSPTECNTGAVSILLGNGDGSFQAPVNYSSGADNTSAVAIADLTGNGIPDLVLTNQCQNKKSCDLGAFSVLRGNGDGTFRPAKVFSSGAYSAVSLALADLNGDGSPDLVIANFCARSGHCGDGVLTVFLSEGNGFFGAPVSYDSGGYAATSVTVADVNGDGVLDLIAGNGCRKPGDCSSGNVAVLLGHGDGTFRAPVSFNSGGDDVTSVAIGDLNLDGRPDLVATNNCASAASCSGEVAAFLNVTSDKTTLTISSSPNPSTVGQSVTLTAVVTSSPPIPAGENVMFYQGGNFLGSASTSNGSATFTTTFSAPQTYIMKVAYPGDPFHKSASKTMQQVVNP